MCHVGVCVNIYIFDINIKNSVLVYTGTKIFHSSSQFRMEFKILASILKIVDISILSNIDIPIPKISNTPAPSHPLPFSIKHLALSLFESERACGQNK